MPYLYPLDLRKILGHEGKYRIDRISSGIQDGGEDSSSLHWALREGLEASHGARITDRKAPFHATKYVVSGLSLLKL